MKDTFTRARTLAADEKWVVELEKAMSEGDWVRVKGLTSLNDRALKNRKIALEISEKTRQTGKFRKGSNYHGDTMHSFLDSIVQDIIAHPEAIFETSNGQRLIFFKNGDVVIMEAMGSARGNVITAYGKSGVKGQSGANALGGLPSDPGMAVSKEMITNGLIPSKIGFFEPAVQLFP